MSESATTTERVVIPGELKSSNPVPPPMTVPLPIVAWPDEFKNSLLGIGALLTGVSQVLGATLIVGVSVATGSGVHDVPLSLQFVIFLVCSPLLLFFGIGYTGAALTCFWDAARNDPVLEITAAGLQDRRSGLSVPWTSVRSAKPVGLAVDLQLRGPVTGWQNPFRIGVLFQRRRLPDHVIVSVAYLDAPAHVVLYTILTLTQRNGGEVITKLPSGLDLYPRLIPQRRPPSAAVAREVG